MDIVDRLIAYRNYTGYSNSQFADLAGIPRPTLSQFLNGRNKRMSDDLTSKLHVAYPDLNILWLLFGEGDMLSTPNIKISEGKNEENNAIFEYQTPDNKHFSQTETTPYPIQDFTPIQQNQPEDSGYTTNQNSEQRSNETSEQDKPTPKPQELQNQKFTKSPTLPTDPAKKIQSIMVFYSDNSFEIFTPGGDK